MKPTTRATWSGWIIGAIVVCVVARIAKHLLVREAMEELEERLSNRLLHQQPRAGQAHLTRIVELPCRLARGCLEIAVLEDEQRSLPAELGGERNDVPRGRDPDVTRGLRRAGERDAPTPGCATSAAPTSSPIPWTRLNTPGGSPASTTRSISSEHDSGDHSAGLRITVEPAARAGAVFQVDSMNGAFQGVITTAGPLGIRRTRLAVPFDDHTRSSYSTARSAYER